MKLLLFHRTQIKGFTLLELLMSISIMGIMTVIFFVRYPETVKRLTLANLTHSAAFIVHEAQVRGSAVDSVNSSVGGYGVYVDLASPNKIILFGDLVDGTMSPYQIYVGDGLYDSSPTDEAKTTTNLPYGYTIAKLCVGSGFPFSCNTENNPAITSLTFSFTRPSPQPHIYVNNVVGSETISAGCMEFHSLLAPLPGHVRSIQVFSSGIIRTINTGCE